MEDLAVFLDLDGRLSVMKIIFIFMKSLVVIFVEVFPYFSFYC